jgi:outer membrane protein assembly factor BamE (lipoprotein component of BamABCDE complex)
VKRSNKENDMRYRILIPIVGLMTLVGCSTVQVGQNFDLSTFESKVQRGATTQAQVRGWLGAPNGIGVAVDTGGERYQEWTYYYGEGRLPNMPDARLKILQIKFDRNGVVRGYNWSGEAE